VWCGVVWWWCGFLDDYKTTPTKVVLSCFGLLVGLWQFPGRILENKLLFPGRLPENKLLFPGSLPENNLIQNMLLGYVI
jgi:hypothetical protein